MRIDAARSTIRIFTYAEGFLSKLAHDVELVCRELSGTADDRAGTLEVPIRGIDVAGETPNRAEILAKMANDVFHGGAGSVKVEATRESVTVTPPRGKTVTCKLKLDPVTTDGTMRITGALDLSLAALGSSPVKGPLNAFRVKDRVEVRFDVVFVAE